MSLPTVSVVIPVYKVEAYLRDCLDSVLAQTYSQLEIILVDDGSPDRCPAICDAYAASDSRIIVIHQENRGLSAARNSGIDAASGKWIVFVDSDDVIAPNMIEALVKEYRHDKMVTAVGFSRFSCGEQPESTGPENREVCEGLRGFIRRRSGAFCWGILYNRSVIEQLHLRFDERLCNLEDVVWNVCYLAHMEERVFLKGSLYHYRRNAASITSRCVDKKWQVRSWFQARSSCLRWNREYPLPAEVLRFLYRYCANNIFAECICGKLTYTEYAAQRIASPVMIRIPETILENVFPRLYFWVYTAMIQMRNRRHRKG